MSTQNEEKQDLCELPFWKDPSILFQHFTLQYTPICKHSPWNFFVRLLILSLFIGFIGSMLGGLSFIVVSLLFGSITALGIIMTTPKQLDPKWDTVEKLGRIVPCWEVELASAIEQAHPVTWRTRGKPGDKKVRSNEEHDREEYDLESYGMDKNYIDTSFFMKIFDKT